MEKSEREEGKMILEKKELCQIEGGAITAALVNAILRGFQFLFDLGKSVGSSIARMTKGNYC